MRNIIPGTTYPLPTVWNLLQSGLSVREWIAQRHGDTALRAWEAAGRPEWIDPYQALPLDQGVVRQGWRGPRWR